MENAMGRTKDTARELWPMLAGVAAAVVAAYTVPEPWDQDIAAFLMSLAVFGSAAWAMGNRTKGGLAVNGLPAALALGLMLSMTNHGALPGGHWWPYGFYAVLATAMIPAARWLEQRVKSAQGAGEHAGCGRPCCQEEDEAAAVTAT